MELLLNFAWLLLALPAYWLWRSAGPSRAGRKLHSLQCLLTLGCVLVILFPVISATDDLRAMRAEMEVSPASKRTIRQITNDKASAWKWQSPPALTANTSSLVLNDEGWLPRPSFNLSVPSTPAVQRAGRAPPDSLLA